MDDIADRLVAEARHLVDLGPDVEAGEPWPLSDAYGAEPEADWGPKELLAHVAEMIPYWHGQIERIVAGPDEPVPFGRVATDPDRLARIGADRLLAAGELLGRIAASAETVAAALRGLEPDVVARRGLHPTLGELTVEAIVERFLVAHLADHDRQLREILSRRGGETPTA